MRITLPDEHLRPCPRLAVTAATKESSFSLSSGQCHMINLAWWLAVKGAYLTDPAIWAALHVQDRNRVRMSQSTAKSAVAALKTDMDSMLMPAVTPWSWPAITP